LAAGLALTNTLDAPAPKDQIATLSSVPVRQQVLSFGGDELKTYKGIRLGACGILPLSLVHLDGDGADEACEEAVFEEMQEGSCLTMHAPSGHIFHLPYCKEGTFSWMKARIHENTGIAVKDQSLYLARVRIEEPDRADATMRSCGIRAGDHVQVVARGFSASALWPDISHRLTGKPCGQSRAMLPKVVPSCWEEQTRTPFTASGPSLQTTASDHGSAPHQMQSITPPAGNFNLEKALEQWRIAQNCKAPTGAHGHVCSERRRQSRPCSAPVRRYKQRLS